MENKEFLIKILDSKEERARIQKRLLGKYGGSLISFTLNIPGRKKDNKTYRDIHKEGLRLIKEKLSRSNYKLIYQKEEEKETGREAYLLVDIDPISLKKLAIELEESSKIARVFDIDIFNKNHKQVSRKDLGREPRKCLICEREARACIKEKAHSYKELVGEIESLWTSYTRRTNKDLNGGNYE